MTHETNIYCPHCKGTGENDFMETLCTQCGGQGEINALAEIEKLRAYAQFIIDGYANQDLDHEDFRVGAYKNALIALER